MVEREIEIRNRLGLHARAAAKLVQVTGRFACKVTLSKNGGDEVDGKSILGILLLAAPQGSLLRVRCAGDGEEEAMAAIVDLVESLFGEEA